MQETKQEKIICLVRHGQSAYNEKRIIQGHLDVPLSSLGHRQAVDAVRRILSFFKPGCIPGIFSSDLLRARQTAAPLVKKLTRESMPVVPVLLDDLREIQLGDWQGKTRQQLRDDKGPDGISLFEKWLDDPVNVIPPGAESMEQFGRRTWRGMEKVIDGMPGLCGAVVFTHGGVISMVLNRILGRGVDKLVRYSFPNTGMAVLKQKGSKLLPMNKLFMDQPESVWPVLSKQDILQR